MKPRIRAHILHAWVNQIELDAVVRLASEDGVSLSEALRECIHEQAKRRGVWRSEGQEA